LFKLLKIVCRGKKISASSFPAKKRQSKSAFTGKILIQGRAQGSFLIANAFVPFFGPLAEFFVGDKFLDSSNIGIPTL